MKYFLILLFSFFGIGIITSQSIPGLHIDNDQTVLFGQDTTTINEVILMWQPSKGALRAGTMKNAWEYSKIGNISTAFGSDTQALGNYSFAAGTGSYANSFAEFSIGQNSLGGGSATIWNINDPIFEIGNGLTTGQRSNLFTIQKNGNVFIGELLDPTIIIAEKLVVDGGVTVGNSSATSPLDGTIRYDGTDMEGRVNGSWESLTSGGGTALWTKTGSKLYPTFTGNVGIGTTTPNAKLSINLTTTNDNDFVFAAAANNNTKFALRANGGVAIGDLSVPPVNGLHVTGNVKIGNPIAIGYKLSVDGKIICEEVRVESSWDWPDYVFEEDYALLSIEELEESIKKNKHLPGIPSAKQIEEEGQAIGDIQKRLLEKLEELTLYIIDQDKRIHLLENELNK